MVQINGNLFCSAGVVESRGWGFLSTLIHTNPLMVIILVVLEILLYRNNGDFCTFKRSSSGALEKQ